MSSSASIINVIAPIVGVVIGSLLTGFNNKKHTRLLETLEQKKLDIDRIEEYYELLDALRDYANKLVLELATSIRESRPISGDGIKRVSTNRLELLSNLYLEELREDSQSLKKYFSELTEVVMSFYLSENMDEDLSKKNLAIARDIVMLINNAISDMKSKVVTRSKVINKVV